MRIHRREQRLIVQDEIIRLQRAPEQCLQRHALLRGDIHFAGEKLILRATVFLGVIHRRVGVAHEDFSVVAIVRIDADADTGADVQVVSLQMKIGREGFEQLGGEGG